MRDDDTTMADLEASRAWRRIRTPGGGRRGRGLRRVAGAGGDPVRTADDDRRGVGAVLDQLEAQGAPVDYRTDLGRVVQGLEAVSDRLLAVERAPALRQDAGKMVEQLNEQRRILDRVDSLMDTRQARERERWQARRRRTAWLGGTGAAGILVGVVLTLAVPRFLPFSLAERTAATVMGERAWDAGTRLMAFANPESAEWIYAAQELVRANAATVASCRAAVAKTGVEQSCTLVVPVQGRSLEMIRP